MLNNELMESTSMIGYYLPPSDGRSSKEKLLETIEYLQKESIDDQAFKILDALANGLIWSQQSDRAVRDLGKQIAQELYDNATQNADYEACLIAPHNPVNWEV